MHCAEKVISPAAARRLMFVVAAAGLVIFACG